MNKNIFIVFSLASMAALIMGIGATTTHTAYADTGINIHGNYNPNCIHHCGGDSGGNGNSDGDGGSGGQDNSGQGGGDDN